MASLLNLGRLEEPSTDMEVDDEVEADPDKSVLDTPERQLQYIQKILKDDKITAETQLGDILKDISFRELQNRKKTLLEETLQNNPSLSAEEVKALTKLFQKYNNILRNIKSGASKKKSPPKPKPKVKAKEPLKKKRKKMEEKEEESYPEVSINMADLLKFFSRLKVKGGEE